MGTEVKIWLLFPQKNKVKELPAYLVWWRPACGAEARLSCSLLPSIGRDCVVPCVAMSCWGTGGVGQQWIFTNWVTTATACRWFILLVVSLIHPFAFGESCASLVWMLQISHFSVSIWLNHMHVFMLIQFKYINSSTTQGRAIFGPVKSPSPVKFRPPPLSGLFREILCTRKSLDMNVPWCGSLWPPRWGHRQDQSSSRLDAAYLAPCFSRPLGIPCSLWRHRGLFSIGLRFSAHVWKVEASKIDIRQKQFKKKNDPGLSRVLCGQRQAGDTPVEEKNCECLFRLSSGKDELASQQLPTPTQRDTVVPVCVWARAGDWHDTSWAALQLQPDSGVTPPPCSLFSLLQPFSGSGAESPDSGNQRRLLIRRRGGARASESVSQLSSERRRARRSARGMPLLGAAGARWRPRSHGGAARVGRRRR